MKQARSAMARRVDDEVVVLNPNTGRYFGLNDVAALVWDRLAHDCTREDLVAAVVAAYDVQPEEAATDVEDLVLRLLDAELIDPDASDG